MSFFKLLWRIISGFFESHVTQASDALEERDWLTLVLHMAVVVITGAAGIIVPVFLVYRFRRLILAIATPIIILAVLIASFYENYKKPKPSTQPLACLSIDETRDSANRKYRSMAQCAFLLFTDLCRYLPGLVKPFSLASVEAPVHFDVTANMVTLFHFIIGRGDNDAPVSAIKEILESVIAQHLQAQDLPISVPAVYTSVDGSAWPGLVVDGVYDLGLTYRVDLAVTNEATVTRLKSRAASEFDVSAQNRQGPRDEDFDG